jgi:hypothetical protein
MSFTRTQAQQFYFCIKPYQAIYKLATFTVMYRSDNYEETSQTRGLLLT